jgi:hypothetical protein
MIRALIVFVVIVFSLGACTQRMVCPAYQSAFLFDKPTQKSKFVQYNESRTAPRDILASNSTIITLPPRDSTWEKSTVLPGPAVPFERKVKKDRYLLLPDKTYKKIMRSLQTVPAKQVLPQKPDSLDIKEELDSAARSVTDTLTASGGGHKVAEEDNVYAITRTKEKYNLDQDAYLWYFRSVLVLPDVRAAKEEKAEKAKEATRQGFFSRLFGKKKSKPDSMQTDTTQPDSTGVKQKRSLNPFKKKSAKPKPEESKKKSDPARKEDDGFD